MKNTIRLLVHLLIKLFKRKRSGLSVTEIESLIRIQDLMKKYDKIFNAHDIITIKNN